MPDAAYYERLRRQVYVSEIDYEATRKRRNVETDPDKFAELQDQMTRDETIVMGWKDALQEAGYPRDDVVIRAQAHAERAAQVQAEIDLIQAQIDALDPEAETTPQTVAELLVLKERHEVHLTFCNTIAAGESPWQP